MKMLSAKFENIWALMSKYTFEIDSNSPEEDLTCIICKKIMVDSYQSLCGCQYCHKCIQGYLGEESKCCPGDKEECKEEHLLLEVNPCRNLMINKKISKLRVHCPNECCPSIEELINMENHLVLCTKQKIDCPYVTLGCDNEGLSESKISIHLSEDSFKHTHLLIEYIQNMRNELSNLRNYTMNYENMNREMNRWKEDFEKMKEHSIMKDNEIEVIKKEVFYLKDDLEKNKLETTSLKEQSIIKNNEIKTLNKTVFYLKNDLEKSKILIDALKEELNVTEEMKIIRKEVSGLKDNLNENRLEIISLKEESIVKEEEKEKQNMEITLLKKENEEKIKIDAEKERKINILIVSCTSEYPSILKRSLNVDFIWRVDEVSKRSYKSIFSGPFTSNNYRLCLYLCIGIGGYVYLGGAIMKGDKDDEVEWPMRRALSVSLLNQDTLESVQTLILSYDTCTDEKERFDRPKEDMNSYIYGCLSHGLFYFGNRPSILVRDSLLVSAVLSKV